MKERLLQLLDMEHLSPSKFADLIGVQRSSVSHVLSGRNNPSYDFLQKTLKAFPGLKADWLMLGEGSMYAHMGRNDSNLFGSDQAELVQKVLPSESPVPDEVANKAEDALLDSMEEQKGASDLEMVNPQERKVVQVMILYNDDTFASFKPSQ